MPTWQLDVKPKNGGTNVATDVPFHRLRATQTIEGPGSIEIDLSETHIDDFWQAGTHRVKLTGPLDVSGFVSGLNQSGRRSGGGDGIIYTARGLGLASVLDWRLVRHQIEYMDENASDIVFGLLDEAESQYNGNMGFSPGTVHGVTEVLTEGYCFGTIIGDSIRELSTKGVGFDWEVNANGELEIWAGSRGGDSGLTLDPDEVTNITIDADTASLVTTVSAIGRQPDPFGPIHDMVRDVNAADTFGRREIAIDVDADDDERPKLIRQATAALKEKKGATLTVDAMWAHTHGPWDFVALKLGDTVDVLLPGWFYGNQEMVCVERGLELDPAAPDDYFLNFKLAAHVTDDEIDTTDPDEV